MQVGYTSLSGFMDGVQSLGLKISDFFNDVAAGAKMGINWIGDKARAEVQNFRARLDDLHLAKQRLEANRPNFAQSPQIWEEYEELQKNTNSVLDKANWVNNQIKSIENSAGISLGAIGILPALVVPAAVTAAIVGAVYLIAKVIDSINLYAQRMSYVSAAKKTGVSELDALNQFDETHKDDGGLFGDASKLVTPLAVLAGIYFLLGRK